MIRLSKRLERIAAFVSPCAIAADVGCDHGFLSIRLIELKIAEHVIASDVREGPLNRAREHILAAGLTDRIETIQCDGLTGIAHADTIIIAGMGGKVMLGILAASPEVVQNAQELILQPQSEIMQFRLGLTKMGCKIVAEDLVIEDEKYYPIMKAVKGEMVLNDLEALYGPVLLRDHNPGLAEYLQWQHKYLTNLLSTLKGSGTDKSKMRSAEVMQELKMNEAAIALMEKQRG